MTTQKNPTAKMPQGGAKPSAQNSTTLDPSTVDPPGQSYVRAPLIYSIEECAKQLDTCPWAGTLTGVSKTLDAIVIISIRCKRWGCPHCGRRKVAALAHRCADADPNRFMTLTVWPQILETPRQAYDRTRRQVPRLFARIRKQWGPAEYLRIVELTKRGWPHYHFILRSNYIPQAWLSDEWRRLTMAPIVDIRRIKKQEHVFRYLCKYLTKCAKIQWTERRVTTSRNFFQDKDDWQPLDLHVTQREWTPDHPSAVLAEHFRQHRIVPVTRDVWKIAAPGEPLTDLDSPGETP